MFAVSEHYKGNKHRNQIVRQDFPTALSEQIREKEDAERQAALYHQMINEQYVCNTDHHSNEIY